jgi:hypothetical protein
VRVVRRRRPDHLISLIGTWLILAVGLLGLYFAGTVGVFAVVVGMALVAFAIGLGHSGRQVGCAPDPFAEGVAPGSRALMPTHLRRPTRRTPEAPPFPEKDGAWVGIDC